MYERIQLFDEAVYDFLEEGSKGADTAVLESHCKITFKYSRSRWPRGLRHRFTVACLVGLWVRIPSGHGYQSLVSVMCFQSSLYRAYHSARGVLPCVCLSLSGAKCNNGPLHPTMGV